LYKSTELTLNEKSKLIKIIQKKNISEDDRKIIKSLLGRLSKKELITLLKISFKNYSQILQPRSTSELKLENIKKKNAIHQILIQNEKAKTVGELSPEVRFAYQENPITNIAFIKGRKVLPSSTPLSMIQTSATNPFTAAATQIAEGNIEDIETKSRQTYITALSDIVNTVQDKMDSLGMLATYAGDLTLTDTSRKLSLPQVFINNMVKRFRIGRVPTKVQLDIFANSLDQTLRNLVNPAEWSSINQRMDKLYQLSGYKDFQSNRFGIPQIMKRIPGSQPFTKPHIDLDGLISPILRELHRQISMFASMDVSINTYSQRELKAIMSNRKTYNWYGLVYKFTQIRDINNRRLVSPGYTRHVVGFTTLKNIHERFNLYIRGAIGLNFQGSIYDAIRALDANGIDPNDAFMLELMEINWNPFDLVIAERSWIAATLAMDPLIGFNIHPGGSGYLTQSSAIPSQILIPYIAKGFNEKEILVALQNNRGLTSLSYDMVVESIQKRWGSLKEAQEIYLTPILKQLIEFGYNNEDLTNIFGLTGRGKSTIAKKWIPRFLGFKSFTDARNNLIEDKLAKLIMKGYSLAQIYQAFPAMSSHSVRDHIEKNWGGSIEKARIILLKPYFDFFFANMYTDANIIKRLGFDETSPFVFTQGNKKIAIMNGEDLLNYIVNLIYKTSIDAARYEVFSKFLGQI
ncbi:hypothetical protein LCGC14_1497080, partial [marine sediment metagenome]